MQSSFGQNYLERADTISDRITSHDVQAIEKTCLASRNVMLASRIGSSKSERLFSFGDGCLLPLRAPRFFADWTFTKSCPCKRSLLSLSFQQWNQIAHLNTRCSGTWHLLQANAGTAEPLTQTTPLCILIILLLKAVTVFSRRLSHMFEENRGPICRASLRRSAQAPTIKAVRGKPFQLKAFSTIRSSVRSPYGAVRIPCGAMHSSCRPPSIVYLPVEGLGLQLSEFSGVSKNIGLRLM